MSLMLVEWVSEGRGEENECSWLGMCNGKGRRRLVGGGKGEREGCRGFRRGKEEMWSG